MDNKFFNFIQPYLQFIDNGNIYRKPFSWLYLLLAAVNLLFPFYVLYEAIDNNIFSADAKFIIVFLLVWIIIAAAGWISFQIWWDRKNKVTQTSAEGAEFVATPVFSHFIQTLGEWFGSWIAFVGFFAGLFSLILGSDAASFLSAIGIGVVGGGIITIVVMPIVGFIVIIGSRFVAEMSRALAAIANNTAK